MSGPYSLNGYRKPLPDPGEGFYLSLHRQAALLVSKALLSVAIAGVSLDDAALTTEERRLLTAVSERVLRAILDGSKYA